ncbi:hypothetical protein BS416_14955 [Cronobacter sakazakii]|nr:hypothetical protein BS409_19890 [Cronobacter sakazakii]PUX55811.1 hypothetical protein BS418_03175 [Cronobacter sakazakii]PUX59175.1 hypothetical protein BS417_09765 [Cronobacter sakazakii]PUX59861.1 hypothetical protein BS416_14955 [Cronobacter sakazakii]
MENNELVKAGHELAKCLDNEPLLDIAKMIVRLADKLEVTTLALREKTKQCEELAAESAALKSAIQTHSESVHFCEVCGKDDPCSTDDVCYALKETTATDAFLRELKAQGVGELAQFAGEEYQRHKAVGDRTGQRKWKSFVLLCSDFANQIRQGGAA